MLTVRARANSEVIVTVYVPGARSRLISFASVVCDYNKDGNVTGADATAVYSVASKAADLRYDLNGDGSVTGADATTVYAIASSAIALPAVTIK